MRGAMLPGPDACIGVSPVGPGVADGSCADVGTGVAVGSGVGAGTGVAVASGVGIVGAVGARVGAGPEQAKSAAAVASIMHWRSFGIFNPLYLDVPAFRLHHPLPRDIWQACRQSVVSRRKATL